MKIAVAGIGYVGLSLAVLLAQKRNNSCRYYSRKVDMVNKRKSPIIDKEIQEFLSTKN